MFRYIAFLSCSFILFACVKRHVDKESVDRISIPVSRNGKFSEIYKFNKVIKLETTEESVFAVPSKIVITNFYILILDQMRDNLLVFGKEGEFIKSLGHKGVGPKEHLSISSFSVVEDKNTLLFYDDYNSAIFYYSLDSLKFKKKEPIDFAFRTFENYNSKLIFYRGLFPSKENKKLSYDVIVTNYDTPREIENKFFPYDFYNGTRGHIEKLLKTKEGLFFYQNYADTIYDFKEGVFIPRYIIDFYNSEVPPPSYYKDRKKLSNIQIDSELLKSNCIYSYRFFKTNKHIFVSYFSQKKHFFYIEELLGNKKISINKFEDDLGFGLDNREPDFFSENALGFVIYPSIVAKKKEEKSIRINAELQDLNVEDNPYLVLFDLKDSELNIK